MRKREFIKAAGAAGLMSLVPEGVRTGAWAAGSDAPEKKEVKIGFIPLTDCSSVVMASATNVENLARAGLGTFEVRPNDLVVAVSGTDEACAQAGLDKVAAKLK